MNDPLPKIITSITISSMLLRPPYNLFGFGNENFIFHHIRTSIALKEVVENFSKIEVGGG